MTGSAPRAPRQYFDKMIAEGDREKCWPWPYAARCGSGRFRYEGRMDAVHLVAWALLRGSIKAGHTIRHSPRCIGTECWNPFHYVEFDGTPNAALTRRQVDEIVAQVEGGAGRREVAERFEVAYTTVNEALRRVKARRSAAPGGARQFY